MSDGMTDAYSGMNTVQESADNFEGITIEIKSHSKRDDGSLYQSGYRYEITKSLFEHRENGPYIDMVFVDIQNKLKYLVEKHHVVEVKDV